MTDRELLMMAYGALKALETASEDETGLLDIIETHLWPPKVSNLPVTEFNIPMGGTYGVGAGGTLSATTTVKTQG